MTNEQPGWSSPGESAEVSLRAAIVASRSSKEAPSARLAALKRAISAHAFAQVRLGNAEVTPLSKEASMLCEQLGEQARRGAEESRAAEKMRREAEILARADGLLRLGEPIVESAISDLRVEVHAAKKPEDVRSILETFENVHTARVSAELYREEDDKKLKRHHLAPSIARPSPMSSPMRPTSSRSSALPGREALRRADSFSRFLDVVVAAATPPDENVGRALVSALESFPSPEHEVSAQASWEAEDAEFEFRRASLELEMEAARQRRLWKLSASTSAPLERKTLNLDKKLASTPPTEARASGFLFSEVFPPPSHPPPRPPLDHSPPSPWEVEVADLKAQFEQLERALRPAQMDDAGTQSNGHSLLVMLAALLSLLAIPLFLALVFLGFQASTPSIAFDTRAFTAAQRHMDFERCLRLDKVWRVCSLDDALYYNFLLALRWVGGLGDGFVEYMYMNVQWSASIGAGERPVQSNLGWRKPQSSS